MITHSATATCSWMLDPPVVPVDLILRLQKYRDPGRASRAIRAAATTAAVVARRLVTPRAVLWRGPVAIDRGRSVRLGEDAVFHTRLLARMLARCTEAYVLVLTLGEGLEREAEALFRARLGLEGLMLETAGWAALELLVRQVRHRLRDAMSEPGTTVTHRLAPGYGDWPVDDQPRLLELFGDVRLPVCVNDAACLFPRKSISAVFGIVPAG